MEQDVERAVVPIQERVLYLEREAYIRFGVVDPVVLEEHGDVHDAGHHVGADSLGDVPVLEDERHKLVAVGVSAHLVDHGVVGADVVPEALLGLHAEVHHLLDVHDILLDQIHHIAHGAVRFVVVDGDQGVLLVPSPVLLPCDAVPEDASMGLQREAGMEVHELLVVPGYPPDVARCALLPPVGEDLRVLDLVGDLVGDYLPSELPVERDGVGEQQRQGPAVLADAGEAQVQEVLHDSAAGVLGIRGDAGDMADIVDGGVDVHPQRVHGDLGDQLVPVPAAQDVRPLEYRELGLHDLVVPPSGAHEVLLGDLEGVAQERVVLIQVIGGQATDLKWRVEVGHDAPRPNPLAQGALAFRSSFRDCLLSIPVSGMAGMRL